MAYKLLSDETFSNEMAILNKNIARLSGHINGRDVTSFAQLSGYIRDGLAPTLFSVGDQFETEKVESLTASIGDSLGITSVNVDTPKFVSKLGILKSGVFKLTFDGATWSNSDSDLVSLDEYGITITGTPVKDDKIVITIGTSALSFDILDFDKCNTKAKNKNGIVLGLHEILAYNTIPFSAPQLLYYAQNGLPAGTYKLTLDHGGARSITDEDGTYMFTLTKDIPAGGGIRHTCIGGYADTHSQERILTGTFVSYGIQPGRVEIESNIKTELFDDSDCINLGTFTYGDRAYYEEDATVIIDEKIYLGKRNVCGRQAYGTNRWRDSVCRQWLNSDAPAVNSSDTKTISNWWKPASVFDMPPSCSKLAGFLYGMDADFVNALGEVEVKTALYKGDRPDTDLDGATYDITYDKIFLQSETNVFGDKENGIAEGVRFEYWKNYSKVKHWNNSPVFWRLRSPKPEYSGYTFCVYNTGDKVAYYSSKGFGIVPACYICAKQTITNG